MQVEARFLSVGVVSVVSMDFVDSVAVGVLLGASLTFWMSVSCLRNKTHGKK